MSDLCVFFIYKYACNEQFIKHRNWMSNRMRDITPIGANVSSELVLLGVCETQTLGGFNGD